MSRRARGEGTVYRDGSTWIARIDLPIGTNGKRRQRKRRARTKTEALARLKELQREIESLENPDGLDRTVAQAVDEWFRVQPAADRQPGTVDVWRWRCDVIKTGIGNRKIGQLTVADCDRFLEAAATGEYGGRALAIDTVRRIRSTLINVLRNEARVGNLHRNVADLSVMPANRNGKRVADSDDGDSSLSTRRTLSHAEYRRLWRTARAPLIVVVDLCGRNGLRPSEARAMRWECVDVRAKTITVNRQMTSGTKLVAPKTRRSKRSIPVDATTLECLDSWRDQQQVKRERAGENWVDTGLVVTTRYGTGINGPNLSRMLTAACEEAAVDPIVPYELRHTAITFQIDGGHETWQVADWAGTSVRMIEDIYRHRLHRVSELGPVAVPDLGL